MIAMVISAAAIAQSGQPEQTNFSAEDARVQHPVAVPADVMRILAKDEMAQNALHSEAKTEPPESWFSASQIHLSSGKRADLVVMGEGPIRGANVTTFWVFRATDGGHELVMMSPAHDLVVKKTQHKGYRDLELLSATAIENWTITLHFDEKKYVKFSEKVRRNGE